MRHVDLELRSPDGLRFYGQCWAPEAEPRAAVCLVHGLGEHTGRYAHVAQALAAEGFGLIGFDLRGHGKTPGTRGHAPSYDALMDDITQLLDEAAKRYPGRPQFLYGHSLGGNLVLNYGLRRKPQVKGVVATSPALRLPKAPPALQLALGKVMYGLVPSFTMANGLDRTGLSRDPEVVRRYNADPLVHDRISARLALDMLAAGEWAIEHAGEWTLPLLLVHGTADRITWHEGTRAFADQVKGDCTLKLWEGFYHETHNEPEKAQVLGLMIDWLQAHT